MQFFPVLVLTEHAQFPLCAGQVPSFQFFFDQGFSGLNQLGFGILVVAGCFQQAYRAFPILPFYRSGAGQVTAPDPQVAGFFIFVRNSGDQL